MCVVYLTVQLVLQQAARNVCKYVTMWVCKRIKIIKDANSRIASIGAISTNEGVPVHGEHAASQQGDSQFSLLNCTYG